MSWSIKLAEKNKNKQDLEDAITAAHRRGILIYCAASPKKADTSEDKYWPSSCQETFSIGAANEHRMAQGYVGSDARYLFPSVNVLSDKSDGGSSAATALAAGLASLILFCLKREKREEEDEREKERERQRGERKQRDESIGRRENRTGKMVQIESVAGEGSSAAGDNPRNLMEKVFDHLTGREDKKYVDIVSKLALDEKRDATYNSVTKWCRQYLTSSEKSLKSGPRDGQGIEGLRRTTSMKATEV
jgi:hypothetical protein